MHRVHHKARCLFGGDGARRTRLRPRRVSALRVPQGERPRLRSEWTALCDVGSTAETGHSTTPVTDCDRDHAFMAWCRGRDESRHDGWIEALVIEIDASSPPSR